MPVEEMTGAQAPRCSDDLWLRRISERWWFNELWRECDCAGSYERRLRRPHSQRREPVIQASKFEFVINLRTAKALGLTIPHGLLSAADEVIDELSNVRFWPKGDIPSCTAHVRFRG